jgi:hypothetical protein
MFLGPKSFILLGCILSFLSSAKASAYKKLIDIDVAQLKKSSLQLGNSFKVYHFAECVDNCDLMNNCLAASLNVTNICTLFSDQTTLFDVERFDGTILMSKEIHLKACANDDYYPDYTEKICKLKFTNQMVCINNEQCSNLKGLECKSGLCQCKLPDIK